MKILNLTYPEKSDIKYKINNYPDGQRDIIITSNPFSTKGWLSANASVDIWKEVLDNSVQIISRLNNMEDLGMIVCATKALRRLGVKEIHLYSPYLLGARSDREFTEGGVSYLVDVIAPIINSLGFESVTVMDVHSDVAAACIRNLKSISNTELVKWATRELFGVISEKGPNSRYPCVLISPDGGSLKKIYKVAEAIGYKGDVICCSKSRDTEGKLSEVNVPIRITDCDFKDKIIIDDICDGGATFINIAKEIKTVYRRYEGRKGKLYLIVTHGIFSKGFEELSKYFDGIYCTNSYSDLPIWQEDKEGNFITTNHLDSFVKQLNVF